MKNKIVETELSQLIKKSLKNPDEFYINIGRNLTITEYQSIKDKLINKDCHTCSNPTCRVESYEKPVYKCVGWENPRIIGKSKVLRKVNVFELL